jgi:hypothetical protein
MIGVHVEVAIYSITSSSSSDICGIVSRPHVQGTSITTDSVIPSKRHRAMNVSLPLGVPLRPLSGASLRAITFMWQFTRHHAHLFLSLLCLLPPPHQSKPDIKQRTVLCVRVRASVGNTMCSSVTFCESYPPTCFGHLRGNPQGGINRNTITITKVS